MKSVYGDQELIDIGHGVGYSKLTDASGEWIGLIEEHPRGDDPSRRCAGSVRFEGSGAVEGRPVWRVVSREPLTLEPSLLCTACGNHGWIRGGRWVPA